MIYVEVLAGEAVGVPPAPLHRDLHLGQLVARGDGVAVLDWDLHAAGDPALDLANLLVYLETRLGARAGAVSVGVSTTGRSDEGTSASSCTLPTATIGAPDATTACRRTPRRSPERGTHDPSGERMGARRVFCAAG